MSSQEKYLYEYIKENKNMSEQEYAKHIVEHYKIMTSILEKYQEGTKEYIVLKEAIMAFEEDYHDYITGEYLYGVDGDT